MAGSLIQIVDENDNPIGAATKQELWQKGLRHRLARVMLVDGNGHILLQKRAATKIIKPNCWDDSVVGHVDAGEDYEMAAIRELREELGLDVTAHELQEVEAYYKEQIIGDKIIKRFAKAYKLTVPHETNFRIESTETSEVKWFTIDEAKSLCRQHPELVTSGLSTVLAYY